MKRLLAILLLLAAPVMADGLLLVLLRTNASVADKTVVREKLQTRFLDSNDIEVSDLGKEEYIANPNVKVWRLVFSIDQIKASRPSLDLPTRAEFEAWKVTHLSNTNHFEVYRVANGDWRGKMDSLGFRAVTNGVAP